MSEVFNSVINRDALMRQIGVNLNKLRITMDWTQAKMAELTGVTEASVSNYIKGKRLPDIDYLVNLCAMEQIKKKGIILRIDDFMSGSFDPQRAQMRKNTSNENYDFSEHKDFVGNYLCYFYDQSKPVHDQDSKTTRELRYGILSVYDDVNCVTADKSVRVYAAFYKETELDSVIRLKSEIDNIYKNNNVIAERNNALSQYYSKVQETTGVYEGKISFSNQHAFVNIYSDVYSDNALMILYSPHKRTDNDYLGGIGSIASVAHGRMHMPTAQKIIISRHELRCSTEEIADHLSLSSAPVSQTEEAIAIVDICRRLYGSESTISVFLDEKDKTAIIENRLNQLVRNYIEKNVCCVGSVSEEEDKKVYSLIKRYV